MTESYIKKRIEWLRRQIIELELAAKKAVVRGDDRTAERWMICASRQEGELNWLEFELSRRK